MAREMAVDYSVKKARPAIPKIKIVRNNDKFSILMKNDLHYVNSLNKTPENSSSKTMQGKTSRERKSILKTTQEKIKISTPKDINKENQTLNIPEERNKKIIKPENVDKENQFTTTEENLSKDEKPSDELIRELLYIKSGVQTMKRTYSQLTSEINKEMGGVDIVIDDDRNVRPRMDTDVVAIIDNDGKFYEIIDVDTKDLQLEYDPNKYKDTSNLDSNELILINHDENNVTIKSNLDSSECMEPYLTSDLTNQIPTTSKTIKKKKQHACIFCRKVMIGIKRHLFTVHEGESEVEEIKTILGNDDENMVGLSKLDILVKRGDYRHNMKTGEKKIAIRLNYGISDDRYVPCMQCLGYITKKSLNGHVKRCIKRGERYGRGYSYMENGLMSDNYFTRCACMIVLSCHLGNNSLSKSIRILRDDVKEDNETANEEVPDGTISDCQCSNCVKQPEI